MITFKLTSINKIKGKGEKRKRVENVREEELIISHSYVSNSRGGRTLFMHYTKT